MTVIEVLAIVAAPTITSGASLIQSLINGRAVRKNTEHVQSLHVLINSNLDKWIALGETAARSEGLAAGIESERQRNEGEK
jgi:hypothetical protein